MNEFDDKAEFPGLEGRRFMTTCWTEVLLASEQESPGAREALEHLCRLYWYPIYAHVRQAVNDPHDAEDLTQEFFRLLIEKNYLGAVDRQRGKFRSFLLVAVKRFLINAHKHATRQKRGGGQAHISLDIEAAESHLQAELATQLSPEEIFDRRWARAVLDRGVVQLRAEYSASGRKELFEALGGFLTDESRFGDYSEVAGKLSMTASTVAVAVHRLRARYRQLVRDAVKPTVADPAEVDEEMKHLVAMVSG
ncbi:MAG: sigma-70 family RNA polymerase sigma factor [Verrucomicrobia bacterium]|nr:sigma-70 family RNA polymerase sigma factor [Verrucomicrobiota bacterium]